MRKFSLGISALALLGLSAAVANAAPVVYSGEDIMAATNSPNPLSAAAETSFVTGAGALGATSLINFETAPLGSFSNLTVAPGVTINGSDISLANQTIRDMSNFPGAPTLDGYNTTPGGANFLEMQGGTLTFTFASPIQAFGAYFSGVQNFTTDTVNFSDGTSQVLNIPEDGTSGSIGALDFVGFTDAGASISSVTIFAGNNGFDDIGVDDVLFGPVASTTPVPEPFTLSLFGAGVVGAAALRRRKKAQKA
jgi:hypothetical protein